jgi:mRNA interferase RelE/StbE
MRALRLEHDIQKYVSNLPPKHAKQIFTKIMQLMGEVRPNDSEHLNGYKNCFRATSGEYRVIYMYSSDDVRVLEVGPRNDDSVYKSFERKYKNLNFAN